MRNFKKALISVGFVFLLSTVSFAIEDIQVEKGSVLSLHDCITIALKNSPGIKNARYNYELSKSNVNIARSDYFPTIGVGTGYTFTGTKNNRVSNGTGAYAVEASLNQLLWNFGKTNSNIRKQKYYLIADEYNFNNKVIETIFDVKEKYYRVLASRATVLINKAYVDINERNYQRTKAYFDEGVKSKIDLVNAEVLLSDSKISLVDSEKNYESSLVELNNAMYLTSSPDYNIASTENFNIKDNVAPVDLTLFTSTRNEDLSKVPTKINDAKLLTSVQKLELLTDYQVEKFPHNFDECIKIAYENRQDLKAYNATLDAVKQNLLYVKRNYYPELSASVGYGFRDKQTTNSLNAGVNLSTSVNIMNQKARVDAAKTQVDIAENNLSQLKQDIYFEVQNAYLNMINLEKEIPLAAVKVRQTRENFELAEGRYYVGLSDYIELQDAKVNYNNAQCTYIETIYNYNIARAALESVISLPQEETITLKDK